ncbi:MAG: methylated-DNA--[protein]-cysteine S-methyltransferase [Ardenticatenaceae bacterium]|nr:methylated-DNA--[protein]-cysteine S-methyltransferase [Ardenticatenaceae bacterium]
MNQTILQQNDPQLIDYERIAAAIRYLEENLQEQPSLDDLADFLYLSPYHTQRLFKRWAGVSPKRFTQFLTLTYAQNVLHETQSTLEATYAAGLSSSSRLHDLFVSIDGVTPAEYKKLGQGVVIQYGYHPTPFGEALLAITERGLCGLYFVMDSRANSLNDLMSNWPNASFIENSAAVAPVARQIFENREPGGNNKLHLFLKGTNFQLKVWEALLKIPSGQVCSYGDLARLIGQPKASRAVGSAVARNAIAYLIPCHRVIRSSGLINTYRWGDQRKKALFVWEQTRQETRDERPETA